MPWVDRVPRLVHAHGENDVFLFLLHLVGKEIGSFGGFHGGGHGRF